MIGLQDRLCHAIREHRVLRIKYGADFAARLFAPHAIYRSGNGNTLLTGTQIENPSKMLDQYVPRNFNLDEIVDLGVSDRTFTPHPKFSSFDNKFKHGVICAVDRP